MIDLEKQLVLIKRIMALSETGLVYAEGQYHRERYQELKEIGLQLLSTVSGVPMQVFTDFLVPAKDYPTPKVDIRGLVLNNRQQLMKAKESVDGKWSIPGGWADIGYTPSEIVKKEIEEETGLVTEVDRLLAVYDKRCHQHPPQPFYVYKFVFLCTVKNGDLRHGFDMEDTAFFDIDNLPELSEDRILKSQIKQLYKLALDETGEVYFD